MKLIKNLLMVVGAIVVGFFLYIIVEAFIEVIEEEDQNSAPVTEQVAQKEPVERDGVTYVVKEEDDDEAQEPAEEPVEESAKPTTATTTAAQSELPRKSEATGNSQPTKRLKNDGRPIVQNSDKNSDKSGNQGVSLGSTSDSNVEVEAINSMKYKMYVADYTTSTTVAKKDNSIVLIYLESDETCVKMLASFKEMAAKYPDFTFYTMKVTDGAAVLKAYGFQEVPLLIVAKDGKITTKKGYLDNYNLSKYIASFK